MGTQRCPVETDRTDLATEAAARWSRSSVAGHSGCLEWSLVDLVSVQSASPHESQLVEEVLAGSFLEELQARLIGDKAYDSDSLDQRLREEYGIELIAPHRRQRRTKTQDGRRLRRYRRRWRVERLFAWLHWFRRLVTRYEYHIENFLGLVQLGCIKLLLEYV